MYSFVQPISGIEDTQRLMRAVADAAKWHAGAFRKGTQIPYIAHPYGVMSILLSHEVRDEDVLIAALFHDTLEDTACTLQDIENTYGRRVAKIVLGVTEVDKSLSWEERKYHTIQAFRQQPYEIKLVAVADKLHNLMSLGEDLRKNGVKLWERFNRGQHHQRWYYVRIAQVLQEDASMANHPMVKLLVKAVDGIFRMPKFPMPECVGAIRNTGSVLIKGEGFVERDIPYQAFVTSSEGRLYKTFCIARRAVREINRGAILQLLVEAGMIHSMAIDQSLPLNFSLLKDLAGVDCLAIEVTLSEGDRIHCQSKDLIEVH